MLAELGAGVSHLSLLANCTILPEISAIARHCHTATDAKACLPTEETCTTKTTTKTTKCTLATATATDGTNAACHDGIIEALILDRLLLKTKATCLAIEGCLLKANLLVISTRRRINKICNRVDTNYFFSYGCSARSDFDTFPSYQES